MTYANGDTLICQWENGFAHDHGVKIFADGSKYEGKWNKNSRFGEGQLTYANGIKIIGSFNQDNPDGIMTVCQLDGGTQRVEFTDQHCRYID